jgi:hypothetical protein
MSEKLFSYCGWIGFALAVVINLVVYAYCPESEVAKSVADTQSFAGVVSQVQYCEFVGPLDITISKLFKSHWRAVKPLH